MEWFSGLGLAAGLFFLIKGLLWLCVPAVVVLIRRRNQHRHAANTQTDTQLVQSPQHQDES